MNGQKIDFRGEIHVGQEKGQTLIEYGLIVVLVSIVAVIVLGLLGEDVSNLFAMLTSIFSSLSG